MGRSGVLLRRMSAAAVACGTTRIFAMCNLL